MRHFNAQEIMQITKIFKCEVMLKFLQQISGDRGRITSNNNIINVNKEINCYRALSVMEERDISLDGKTPKDCNLSQSQEYHARGACDQPIKYFIQFAVI
jgi:hypothetical protein